MLDLENYRQHCLDRLREYRFQAGEHGARGAFVLMTERPYGGVPHLPTLSCVCTLLPRISLDQVRRELGLEKR